jgi:hypothetical protein
VIELPRVQTTATRRVGRGGMRVPLRRPGGYGGHVLGIERRWRAGARRAIGWPAARAFATSHGCSVQEAIVARLTPLL